MMSKEATSAVMREGTTVSMSETRQGGRTELVGVRLQAVVDASSWLAPNP
jgi:hypothetical protein